MTPSSPAKATVVDVARTLGVSRGSVYGRFPARAALREAVTGRWLVRALALVMSGAEPPAANLRHWLRELSAVMGGITADDPGLLAAYGS